MCGLYGCIGKGWNLGVMRALALCNESRGTDSTGFFDSTGKMVKVATTASDAIRQKNISAWLERSEASTWFCGGHTRMATRGSVNRRNSHPFRYGRIIGSHNGCVDCPDGYVVDSQYLFDLLSKAKGNYNAAWADVVGYWAISYFDGEYFYLQVHNGELNLCEYRGVWYYSSSAKHLESCIGHNSGIKTLGEGETVRFSKDGTMEVVEPFVSKAPEYWGKKFGCSNTTRWYESGKRSIYRGGTGSSVVTEDAEFAEANVRDFDAQWREAWAEYSGGMEDSDDQQKG